MADEASAIWLLICSYEVWVKVTYDWSTACASQSYDISLSIKLKKNGLNYSVFLVLMFMLMST